MSLKLGTFPVERLQAGPTTNWSDGVLTVDVGGLTELATELPNVEKVSIELTSPGDSSKIIHVNDVLEPRVKVDGPGQVFPGVCNRPVDPVGMGVTHRLGGLAVVRSTVGERDARVRTSTAKEALQLKQNERPQDYIDMSGPGAVTPMASLHNICLSVDAVGGMGPEDRYLAAHTATLRVVDAIARSCETRTLRKSKTWTLPGKLHP